MKGTVRIETPRLSYARRYNGKQSLRKTIKLLVKRFNLTNYTINIRPDVDEETGEDIKHRRESIYSPSGCAPCVVLDKFTVVGNAIPGLYQLTG